MNKIWRWYQGFFQATKLRFQTFVNQESKQENWWNHFQAFRALRPYSSSSAPESIYELRYKCYNDCVYDLIFLFYCERTYNLVPKDVGKFMALSKDKFHLRTKHSVLLGKIIKLDLFRPWISKLNWDFNSRLLDSRTRRSQSSCPHLEIWKVQQTEIFLMKYYNELMHRQLQTQSKCQSQAWWGSRMASWILSKDTSMASTPGQLYTEKVKRNMYI